MERRRNPPRNASKVLRIGGTSTSASHSPSTQKKIKNRGQSSVQVSRQSHNEQNIEVQHEEEDKEENENIGEQNEVEEEEENSDNEAMPLPNRNIAIHRLKSTRFVDNRMVDDFGWKASIHTMCENVGWIRLVCAGQPTYVSLATNFLRTLKVIVLDSREKVPTLDKMIFKLKGHQYTLTRDDVNKIFNFYANTSTRHPSELHRHTFWHHLTGEEYYNPQLAKATLIRSPVIRYAHKIMAYVLFGRGDSQNNVRTDELAFLYCMLHGKQMDTASFLAQQLDKAAKSKPKVNLYCGGIVTIVAKYLNVPIDENDKLDNLFTMDEAALKHMKMLQINHTRRWYYCLNNDRDKGYYLPDDRFSIHNEVGITVPFDPTVGAPEPPHGQEQEQEQQHEARNILEVQEPPHPDYGGYAGHYRPFGDSYDYWGALNSVRQDVRNLNTSVNQVLANQDQIMEFLRTGNWPPPSSST